MLFDESAVDGQGFRRLPVRNEKRGQWFTNKKRIARVARETTQQQLRFASCFAARESQSAATINESPPGQQIKRPQLQYSLCSSNCLLKLTGGDQQLVSVA